jgi:hypothetical protein
MTDTRTIEELAQIFEPPAEQQPMRDGNSLQRKQQIIQGAIYKRRDDQVQIEKERDQYQKELEKRLRQQELELNPEKKLSQQTFLDSIKENTISGQVVKSREEIQKGLIHITPQGSASSYTSNGSNYSEQ